MPFALARWSMLSTLLIAALCSVTARAATPPPLDVPYPGTLAVSVDATDLDHRLFRVHESIPVVPGPLTLLLPRWLPGYHGPYGKPTRLAGLVISANGQRIDWHRDPLDPMAWQLEVPTGVDQLELSFQHVNPQEGSDDPIMMKRTLLRVLWEGDVLYPAGYWS